MSEPVRNEAAAPAGPEPAPGGHDPYAALRHRDYLLYTVGGVIANLGTQAQGVAIWWELWERTRDPMAMAWAALLQALPVMVLALPAGHLADRLDRRRQVMLAQFAAAGCSLGLALISVLQVRVEWMYLCLFLVATARAFHFPAGQSLMPLLVPPAVFGNAVTWRTSGFQVASMVGPALGGMLIAWWHGAPVHLPGEAPGTAAAPGMAAPVVTSAAAGVYVAGAATALLLGSVMLVIRPRPQARSRRDHPGRALLEGVGFVWRTKVVLAALTLDLFAVLLGGMAMLLPEFTEKVLHVGEAERPMVLGWMRTAEAVGALTMAMVLAHLPPPRRAGRLLLLAVAGFGVATIGFGLSRSLVLSLLLLAVIGAMDNISVVVRHTLVQTRTPDEMRGRVSAVNSVFISASNELGGFESNVMSRAFGPVVSVISGGVGTLAVVALAAWRWPEIRKLGALVEKPAEVQRQGAVEVGAAG